MHKENDLATADAASGVLATGPSNFVLTLFLVLALGISPMPPVWGSSSTAPPKGTNSAPLTYISHGHVLSFGTGRVVASNGMYALQVAFQDANVVMPTGDVNSAAKSVQPAQLGRVTYANLWDGITLTYRQSASGIFESTYAVAPHANADAIRLRYNAPVSLNADGSLAIAFASGRLIESAPEAWQVKNGAQSAVAVSFKQSANNEVSFVLGSYDHDSELYIDPTLTWNSFLGGSGYDAATGIALDGTGNIYTVGYSSATWGNPITAFNAGAQDVFVAKLAPDGDLIWNTFLGCPYNDSSAGIAVSQAGNVYVGGYSSATWGGPKTVRPYTALDDAFVAKLDSHGHLLWNTFLGGLGYDFVEDGEAVAVDGSENVYLVGSTGTTWGSPVNPYTSSLSDAFVAKIDANGYLLWNTFVGGGAEDHGLNVAPDGAGNVYVVGSSYSSWGNPVRAYTYSTDAFVVKLDSSGVLLWNAFLGGTGVDHGNGVAVDGDGNLFVVGESENGWGNPARAFSPSTDANPFVAKLNPSGTLLWNTFMGDDATDHGGSITLDGTGYVYVAGTSEAGWGCEAPLTCTIRAYQGWNDIFAAKLDAATGKLLWNTFLGSSTSDWGEGVAVDTDGNVFVAGTSDDAWGYPTTVRNFTYPIPWTDPPHPTDAVIAKLDAGTHSISGNAGVAGATLTYTDGIQKLVTSAADGSYSLPVSYNWSGSVVPSMSGYCFSPAQISFVYPIIADQTAQNFTAAAPGGKITTLRPTYSWTRVEGATKYRYQIWKGATLKFTHSVWAVNAGCPAGASISCSNRPAETLGYAGYRWRVQALVNNVWQDYQPFTAFSIPLVPNAGSWTGMNGDVSFRVQGDPRQVVQFKIIFRVICGRAKVVALGPSTPVSIVAPGKFSFTSGHAIITGKFTSFTRIVGTARYKSASCDSGTLTWTAQWKP